MHLIWLADETGPPRRNAGGGGFFKYIVFYTELHGAFLEVDCVEGAIQSPKFRTETSDVSLGIVHNRLIV